MSRTRYRAFLLMMCEAVILGLCGLGATYLRFGAEARQVLFERSGLFKVFLAILIAQAAFYLFDLYDLSMIRRRIVLFVRTLQAVGVASIALAVFSFGLPELAIGRGVLFLSMLLMLTAMVLWRVFVMWLLDRPGMAERVIILGTGQRAIDIAREVLNRREEGYKVVGFVGDDPDLIGRSLINPSVVGLTAELERVVRDLNCDRIVVAMDDRRGSLPLETLLNLKLPDAVAIDESVTFIERLAGKVNLELLQPSWLIFASHAPGVRLYRRARRLLDIVLASIGLLLALPVMLVTAIAIRLESDGPIFYRQERVGLKNRTFDILKFRSMRTDAEKHGAVWAGKSDPRATRVGRIIRKLRIDEIPQFINILKGDMSFIGPRPERPMFVEQLSEEIPFYAHRHLVKPGLTGWAQVRYPYGASVEDTREKLQYDLYYIKNQSPVLDAIILFETARLVLFGRGAR